MYGVLKLYFGLRAKCLWRMIKELKLLVIPVLLLFLLLGKLIVIDLVSAPIYYSIHALCIPIAGSSLHAW